MANLFSVPGRILSGEGALEMSGPYLETFGKKALIVTDEMMEKLGNLKRVTDVLEQAGVAYAVYTGVSGEPTDEMIEKGAAQYKADGCDFLIGLGGGSPIDSMKAIGAVVSGGKNIAEYMGRSIDQKLPPTAAIPTTAGTGSEATQFTIITDTKNNVKMLLKGPSLLPSLAVIDPVFTATAPQSVTAATGVDALCHAVEAFTSLKAFPLADSFAVSAVKRIFRSLKRAYDKGDDMEAREQMALAALEAGISFNNSSVTIVHGMSRPIGALYHVPHGLSNAMLLPECLKFAVSGAEERFCELARETGLYEDGMTVQQGAQVFISAVCDLCASLNVQTLAEFGVDKEDFFQNISKMADDAIASGSPANTRRQPTKEDITEIYEALWK
ncbi:iron-containing alcohol dehydrogenase [Bacilliculturomica massiliensis]|uniref:iron-containing alcohol dehydrogenase n=1 Tax=Bacilliculturomica massiliensis TaxID=1917867 RepID=UPI0010326EA2|nr:iron-containing alcohol dehydrogenase [Bacilliculturomica massiliensis]